MGKSPDVVGDVAIAACFATAEIAFSVSVVLSTRHLWPILRIYSSAVLAQALVRALGVALVPVLGVAIFCRNQDAQPLLL